MKKMLSATAFLLILSMLALTLCSCSNPKREIIGTWSNREAILKESFTFRSDGTGSLTFGNLYYSFNYIVKDGKIELDWDAYQNSFSYNLEDDYLIITWEGRGTVACKKDS